MTTATINTDENSPLALCMNEFCELCKSEDSQKAYEVCKKGIKELGEHKYLLENMGYVQMKLGNYKQAIEYFDKSIKIDRNNHLSFYYRGYCHYMLGDLHSAIQDCDLTLYRIDICSEAYYLRAICERQLNWLDETKQDIEKALVLKPTNQEYIAEKEKINSL